MRGLSIVLVVLLGFACSSEVPASLEISPSAISKSIVNGTRSPQTLELTDGEKLAIGFIADADADGDNYCTGTLISPRLLVTAGHCVENRFASQTFFGIGEQPLEPLAVLPVSEIRLHPTIDFAVLILGLDAQQIVPEVEFLSLNRDLTKDSWVGEWVDAAGFGDTYSSETGLFFAKVEIIEYAAEALTVDGHGDQGICYGDSGGPILWQKNEFSNPVIVGTEQWGDASCVDQDHLARTDRVLDFVDSILAEELPPFLEECNGTPDRGICSDGIRFWCSGGYQHTENCAEQGKACGWRGERIGNACLPESCGELDYFGRCNGETLEWCGTRGFRTKDCAARGLECVYEGDEIGYNCGGCTQCGGECVDYATSVDHCGGCGQPCAPVNAIGSCENAACFISGCADGFLDVDGLVENGCEFQIKITKYTLKESYAGCAVIGGPSSQATALWLVGLLGLVWVRRRRL